MPDWKSIIRQRVASLRLEPTAESDLVEEMAQHLEDRYRELRSAGVSEPEAERQVTSELDDMHPLKAELDGSQLMPREETVPVGDAPAGNFVEDLWRDLRYAGRAMRKNQLFVLFVVMTLGLGIGANTTVFTVINTLILNPLPLQNASELATIGMAEVKSTSKSKVALPMSYLDLKDFQAKNEVFSSLAGYTSPRVVTLQTGGASERLFCELVSGNYFGTLGLRPAVGRFFLPEEDSTPGRPAAAVMNYGTWQSRFGGSNDIVAKTLRLNNVVFTVIGVAPPKFIGVNAIFGPDLWIPATMMEQLLPNEMRAALSDRSKAAFLAVGRLKRGIGRAQAEADIGAIASALAREYPETNAGHTAMVQPLSDVVFGDERTPVVVGSTVLLIVVGIVLLIACSNVANLLLARSAARQHEIAVRLAIGASRGRLVRQLLSESVLLGLISGLAGLLIAYAGLRLLWSSLPSTANFIAPKLDTTVFVFALVVSLLTGFVFGTIPALRASRVGVAETLKEESHTVGKSGSRITFGNVLLAGQVAFSFLLLVTAALFLRSIQKAYEFDPGFQWKNLAVVLTNPGQAGYGKPQAKAFYKEVRERVARLPGVESVSWASNLPLWARIANGLHIEGHEQRSKAESITTVVNTVDTNYFETAGVGLDRGREFTEMDQENSMPVAIVNEKLAHDYWPNGDAVGKRIQLPGENVTRQIVGVARVANYSTFAESPQLCVYVPSKQNYSDAMVLYVRTKGDPQQILIPLQREIHTVGPQIYLDVRTGRQILDGGLFGPRMGVALLTVFGLLALGLASIGLYGIMAYSVNQRTREIGVRMALGAARGSVLRLILKQGMSVVLTGVIIGFVAALFIGQLLSRMLYGIGASDPISVAGAALVLAAVALVACYLPALRASHVDPLTALRES